MPPDGQAQVIADLPVRRRVRSGCERCKKAHVKCNEQRPSCLRCSRHGHRCAYPAPKQSHFREPRQLLPSTTLAPCRQVAASLPRLGPGEVRYYDRFRNQVASAMGNQMEGPSDFWLRCVLRESSVDECILDIVVAIGALAYARDHVPSRRPLFLSGFPNQHYREAIKHYAKALEKLRRRIADPSAANLPRTILINTVLFSFFESIQGNTESSDKLVAHGLSLLKDSMLQDSGGDHSSRIAAVTDDDGVLEAESFLVRTATWNIQYSPMYPHQGLSVLSISCQRPHLIPLPSSTDNIQDFWKAWWHIVTMAAVWHARSQAELASAPCLSTESLREHDVLLSRLQTWEAAALERMSSSSGLSHATQVFIGARVLSTAVYCGIDPTGARWDASKERCLEILSYYHAAIANDEFAYARNIIYDAILAGVSQVTLSSRDIEVRFGALAFWKQLVHRESSWEIKSVFMGASALIAAEEKHRNAQGHIPVESRYKWTHGAWNDSYTEFHVVLTPRAGPAQGELNLVLRPAEFHLE